MNDLNKKIEKLNTKIKNFQAFNTSKAEDGIFKLAGELFEHTLLRLISGNTKDKAHWEIEIFSYLSKMKRLNKVKTPKGKIPGVRIGSLILGGWFDTESDLKYRIELALEKEDLDVNLAQNYLSKLNLKLAIDSIYEDYVEYISNKLNDDQIKNKINKYYVLPR